VFYVLLASVLTSSLPDAAAVVLTVTGLFGGAAHYAAVLAHRDRDEVERATAVGFFFGFGLGLLGLGIDSIA
jgi:hypothetical protein